MWRYVVKRLLLMLVVLFFSAIIIFTILYFTPGNPAEIALGDGASAADVAALEAKWGIDKPYFVQLGNFMYQTFFKFNLGISWKYNVPVTEQLLLRLPRTVLMGLTTIIIGLIVGIPMGINAARHQGGIQDYGVVAMSMLFISLPSFWVSMMLIVLFSIKLGWLPSYGIGGIQYYILPVIAASMGPIASNARQSRSSMLEVIRSDFVTTARAKGQKEKVVVSKHMLPNAMMPILTNLGSRLGHVVAGSTVIEVMFSIPGVGNYLMTGINDRDFPVIRGCTLFFVIFSSLVILLTDLAYSWLDPRIKARYIAQSAKPSNKAKEAV